MLKIDNFYDDLTMHVQINFVSLRCGMKNRHKHYRDVFSAVIYTLITEKI